MTPGPEGKDLFSFGKEQRRKTIHDNAQKIRKFLPVAEGKIRGGYYTWVDSRLDRSGGYKPASFFETFEGVIPKNYNNLQGYIEDALDSKAGHAVGVEFGGPGSNLFSDFTPGFFEESFGTTLIDHRDPIKDVGYFERDKETHHTVIEGDILKPHIYRSIQKALNGRKADLIIERMGKGLEFIPTEPYFISDWVQLWYELLAERGLMLIQTPVVFNGLLKPWAEMLKEKYGNTLDPEYTIGVADDEIPSSTLRLRKIPGAPAELPMLDPWTVRKISKGQTTKEV